MQKQNSKKRFGFRDLSTAAQYTKLLGIGLSLRYHAEKYTAARTAANLVSWRLWAAVPCVRSSVSVRAVAQDGDGLNLGFTPPLFVIQIRRRGLISFIARRVAATIPCGI